MKFKERDRRKISPHVDLTPLIDVVFQLLIFFMLSATFVIQSSIQIEIPEAEGATTLEKKDLSITLAHGEGGPDNGGQVYVDNVEIATMEELSRILSEKIAEDPDLRVVVRGDARINHGRLMEVLGISNSVGIRHYGLEAQLPDDE